MSINLTTISYPRRPAHRAAADNIPTGYQPASHISQYIAPDSAAARCHDNQHTRTCSAGQKARPDKASIHGGGPGQARAAGRAISITLQLKLQGPNNLSTAQQLITGTLFTKHARAGSHRKYRGRGRATLPSCLTFSSILVHTIFLLTTFAFSQGGPEG